MEYNKYLDEININELKSWDRVWIISECGSDIYYRNFDFFDGKNMHSLFTTKSIYSNYYSLWRNGVIKKWWDIIESKTSCVYSKIKSIVLLEPELD